MRASDYIFKRLTEVYGVERVFLITGGGAMHLNDAVCQSGLAYTCCHHEQACAIAAEGVWFIQRVYMGVYQGEDISLYGPPEGRHSSQKWFI